MSETRTREQYNKIAARYEHRWQNYLRYTLGFLKVWSQIAPEKTVLDIACGTGLFEAYVCADQPHQRMTGIDLSTNMLAVAQQRFRSNRNLLFYNASATALPFAAASFDIVVSANALHYFDDPLVVLAEMRRVLKQAAKLSFLTGAAIF